METTTLHERKSIHIETKENTKTSSLKWLDEALRRLYGRGGGGDRTATALAGVRADRAGDTGTIHRDRSSTGGGGRGEGEGVQDPQVPHDV